MPKIFTFLRILELRCETLKFVKKWGLIERFREVYDDFYRMGMEARRLKNIFGVNGTALLLDSSLAQFHATATNLDAEDTAAYLWDFQKNIASIVTFLTGADDDHNPFYLEQFNEDSA